MLSSSQLQFDRDHIWHPYTSLTEPLPVYPVHAAKGVYIELEDGRQLLDGMSSWWCAIHGYGHPKLVEAATQQLDRMSHIMFGGLTHAPAIELCEKLVEITPAGLDRVFLCDSGSVSVEVALKMAVQYWQALQRPGKKKILALRMGYHGDTIGAMSVCDPVNGMHHMFKGLIPEQVFVDAPVSSFDGGIHPDDQRNLENIFEQHHNELAAFILEPIVQGAGGMRMYSPAYLKKAKALCEKYEVLLIADEIATGFGRTGKMFALEHAAISADILCVGKALTGGMLSLAATLCTKEVSNTIGKSEAGVFMHGPTFMGNPLACSVAKASLDLLQTYDLESMIARIEAQLEQGLRALSHHENVKEVRVCGAIGVVECYAPIHVANIQSFFVDAGVWIRPFRNLIYIMPPFVVESSEVEQLCAAIRGSLEQEHHFQS